MKRWGESKGDGDEEEVVREKKERRAICDQNNEAAETHAVFRRIKMYLGYFKYQSQLQRIMKMNECNKIV